LTHAQATSPRSFDDYVSATSVEAAVRALADGDGTPVAGGTDLWIQKDLGVKPFAGRLVNIRRIAALRGIEERGGRIRVGALTTMTEVLDSDCLRRFAPVLPATADRFASVQIRNVATIGGNIINASPAADFVVPLLCLDAEAELACWRGERVATRCLPLGDLLAGPGHTRREPVELLTAVHFDTPAADFHAAFCKSGPRPALEIARVSLCLAGRLVDRRLTCVRLALGAVAPTAIRCLRTEATIEGAVLDDTVLRHALECLDSEIAPIDDVRSSAWYRRHLARTYLEQELRRVLEG